MGKKLTIEFIKEEYSKKGYKFLDNYYNNNHEKHNIKYLKCGNEWKQNYGFLQRKVGCPQCAGNIQFSLEFIKEQYISKDYLFLDNEYHSCMTQYNIRCLKCGYEWKQNYNSLQQGRGCVKCAVEKRKKTCLEKYGKKFINQVEVFKNKAKSTNFSKYGCLNPMQNHVIALKSAKKVNHPELHYHWLTGEEIWTQGSYESSTIYDLNNRRINYLWQPKTFTLANGKTYRPDLYLIDEDKWVEIKGYFRKDALEKWTEFHEKICPNSELWDGPKLKEFKIIKG